MDWLIRCVLSSELLLTLNSEFCIPALDRALGTGRPEILNSDQDPPFTSIDLILPSKPWAFRSAWIAEVEPPWRTVKCEEAYLKEYLNVPAALNSSARDSSSSTTASTRTTRLDTRRPHAFTARAEA